ncbi:MAG TPA: hypothetical protein VGM36_05150, partial [Rhizomicrobium sp.]
MAGNSLVEEKGEGGLTLRPLWMLLPYLWPKGRPDLKLRVFLASICLMLAIVATTAFPLFMGWITNGLARKPAYTIAVMSTLALVGGYVL